MTLLLLLATLLLPQIVFADCSGLTMTPCMESELDRIDQRHATYGQNWPVFEPAPRAPSVEALDQRMPARDTRSGLNGDDWTFYNTPQGTYKNFGNGWILGPDNTPNVAY